jgi:hypothetical protein
MKNPHHFRQVEPSRRLTGFSNGLGKNQPWKAAPHAITVNPPTGLLPQVWNNTSHGFSRN